MKGRTLSMFNPKNSVIMTESELNSAGVQFSYDETQRAYRMLGIHTRVEDYPPMKDDFGEEDDYDAYFNDFDKWWKGLSSSDKRNVYDEVIGQEKERRSNIKIAVVEQLVNMLTNDILCENGAEGFEGWCADGEVFELNGCNERDVADCMRLVRKVAPIVDNLVLNYLNPDNDW